MKELVIGCDNAAIDLKYSIIEMLDKKHIAYIDVGVKERTDNTMYPEIAKKAIDVIVKSGFNKEGILLCGTGIGMSVAANKFKGIYAAVCHDVFSAERARLSNDTNVITMGARIIGTELAKKVLKEWLALEFKPSRSTEKINLIKDYENNNFK